jgi:hypothetical protein
MESMKSLGKRRGRGRVAHLCLHVTPSERFACACSNIIDGWRALITGGPTPRDRTAGRGGATAQPKVIIASIDRIAADLTGVAVLRTLCPPTEPIMDGKPFEHPQLAAAMAHGGIGITRRSEYVLSGPTVPNLAAYKADAIR